MLAYLHSLIDFFGRKKTIVEIERTINSEEFLDGLMFALNEEVYNARR